MLILCFYSSPLARFFNEKLQKDEMEVQRIQAEVKELKTKFMTVRGELDTLKVRTVYYILKSLTCSLMCLDCRETRAYNCEPGAE